MTLDKFQSRSMNFDRPTPTPCHDTSVDITATKIILKCCILHQFLRWMPKGVLERGSTFITTFKTFQRDRSLSTIPIFTLSQFGHVPINLYFVLKIQSYFTSLLNLGRIIGQLQQNVNKFVG